MSDIERELEAELHRVLDPVAALPVPARRTTPSRTTRTRALLGGAGAALTFKLLSGAVAAAAAVTVAGAATTGSINPADWGQQVREKVESCKAELADGQHGIGDCVSAFASQHGQAVASDARHHGQGEGNENGSGSGPANSHGGNPNANDHAKDRSTRSASPKDPARSTEREPSDPAMQTTVHIPPQQ